MIPLPVAGVEVPAGAVVLLGLFIGLLAGFFGVGGGFLLTPMLNALLGIPYHVAVGSSLSQMVGLSAAASMGHARMGNIDYRLGLLLLVGAGAGAEMGAQVLEGLKAADDTMLLGRRFETIDLVMSLVYAVLLSAIGWSVGREALRAARMARDAPPEPTTSLMHALRRIRLRPLVALPASGIEGISVWILVVVGLLNGFLSGLLGVGGGFMLLPVLIYVIGCRTIVAVGSDLFQIVFKAAYGALTHAVKGNVDLVLVGLMLLGSAVGGHVGAGLTRRFDAARLRGGFALLAFLGVFVVMWTLIAD